MSSNSDNMMLAASDNTMYGAIPLVKTQKSTSRAVKAAVLAAVLCGLAATAYIQPALVNNLKLFASPLEDPVEHCELDEACDTCGKALFEKYGGDTYDVCASIDEDCSGECSSGELECVTDTLCGSDDDDDGEDPVAHCDLPEACDTCGKNIFESSGGDFEVVCSTIDATCSADCTSEELECVTETFGCASDDP